MTALELVTFLAAAAIGSPAFLSVRSRTLRAVAFGNWLKARSSSFKPETCTLTLTAFPPLLLR